MRDDAAHTCHACLGAPAEVAVWSLYAQPKTEWFLPDPPYTIGLVACPACGQLFINDCGIFPGDTGGVPNPCTWFPVSFDEARQCRSLPEDDFLILIERLAEGRPRLAYDYLGERWERTRDDWINYHLTSVYAVARCAGGSRAPAEPIALNVQRLLKDGFMHNIYPGTNRPDAIGVVGADRILDYAANEATRRYLRESDACGSDLYAIFTEDVLAGEVSAVDGGSP